MAKCHTVREFIERFDRGDFNAFDVDTQISAGWYDWFCSTRVLHKKTQKLGKIVKRIAKSDKIDIDNMYVWFKNNCPLYGNLYDDIRFATNGDKDGYDGNVYVIAPRVGYKVTPAGKRAQVSDVKNGNFEAVEGTMRDVYKYFGV